MTRTVVHISKEFKTSQNIQIQPSHLFPFLQSKLMDSQSKRRFTMKSIQAQCSLSNIKQYLNSLPQQSQRKDFVFFGRSNVGKSTLLNSLIQNYVAITSKKPGKTKKLLFVKMNTVKDVYLVDCPGYGYANNASKGQINQWGKLIQTYLKMNPFKINILVLFDVNHGIKYTDVLLLRLLKQYKKQFTIVFTKCDGMDKNDYQKGIKIVKQIQQEYSKNMDYYVHFTSARMHVGINQLRNHLMFLQIKQQFSS